MTRAVGYCENSKCLDFAKGVFLLNSNKFKCPRCLIPGHIEIETKKYLESSYPYCSQVIVHFDFSIALKEYVQRAIVAIDDIRGGNILEIKSPLTRVDSRAMKIAETALASCNYDPNPSSKLGELVLPLDNDLIFYSKLSWLEEFLVERNRRLDAGFFN